MNVIGTTLKIASEVAAKSIALADDISTMSTTAVKNTVGILGDDLAAVAGSQTDTKASRELPVLWKIAKGSLKNKAIIGPAVLGASIVAPVLIPTALVAGGLYLSYEAAEATLEGMGLIKEHEEHSDNENIQDKQTEEELENEKVNDSIKTDFVLSLEIMIIAMGSVATAPILMQGAALSAVAIATTAGVYGTVAGIVRMDDIGLNLIEKENSPILNSIGKGLVLSMPGLIKGLTIVGTMAMAVVGGSILSHHIPGVHSVMHMAEELPSILSTITPIVTEMGIGAIAGSIALGSMKVAEPAINWIKENIVFQLPLPEGRRL